MKKQVPSFLAGMTTMALISSLGIGALAASGQITINVDPINIQVNGDTFVPKDANGATVPVFAYSGTTYAPLRALAEAYGLEVGYNAGNNMATVEKKENAPVAPNTTTSTDYSTWSAEDEAAYQEFKGMWTINRTEITADNEILYNAKYLGDLGKTDFITYWDTITTNDKEKFGRRLAQEYQLKNPTYIAALYFLYSNTDLGYAFGYLDGLPVSSFKVNPFNIHTNINI